MRILLALISMSFMAPAFARDAAGDAANGKKIAARVCAECHDITGGAVPKSPPGNAPTFLSLAKAEGQTLEMVRRNLRLPDGHMVNLFVTGQDADDVASYILSLR